MERPELVSHSQSNSDDSYVQLSDIAISLISRSDAVYLSTSRFHDVSEDMRDMDVNHRGGPTGANTYKAADAASLYHTETSQFKYSILNHIM